MAASDVANLFPVLNIKIEAAKKKLDIYLQIKCCYGITFQGCNFRFLERMAAIMEFHFRFQFWIILVLGISSSFIQIEQLGAQHSDDVISFFKYGGR